MARRLVAAQPLGAVGHDAQRAHDDAGVARLGGDPLRLVGGGLGDAAAEQPLGAVEALLERQRGNA